MEKHFVVFYSPGTFVSEVSSKPIDTWNVGQAVKMAKDIVERYNAKPYGFRFITRSRGDDDLDSKETASSNFYFLGGKIETYEEIVARDDPDEEILRSNMRINEWNRVVVNTNSWKVTLPLNEGDVVLEW